MTCTTKTLAYTNIQVLSFALNFPNTSVVGWIGNTEIAGVERGDPYPVNVGYIKGSQVAGTITFDVMQDPVSIGKSVIYELKLHVLLYPLVHVALNKITAKMYQI